MGFLRRWRLWLRALHRDAGYFVIGLTFVYALSGLAVNHLADWDPNFEQVDRVTSLQGLNAKAEYQRLGTKEFSQQLAQRFEVEGTVLDVYDEDPETLELTFEETTLYVDFRANEVRQERQRPRFILRVINWLHLNRGKAAWTYIADLYAGILLYLAVSGYFMLRQKRKVFNRREFFVLLGIALPVGYVLLSGGP